MRWLPLLSVLLGVAAQVVLSSKNIGLALCLYLVAIVCAWFGIHKAQSHMPDAPARTHKPVLTRRLVFSLLALVAGLSAYTLSADNLYRGAGVAYWALAVIAWCAGWMDVSLPPVRLCFNTKHQVALAVGVLLLLGIGFYFRFASLYENPLDMNSDQAEKLLDIHDILNGTPHIFFERNTGREPWQFYWTVALIRLLNLQPDFMALKIGTALIGWLMLPAVFLLAREVFNTRVANIALLFAAVASWGVITARFGLRYPLAPCAVAWTMYFLIRALKRNERTSMLLMGICLGVGLQGYTAFRFMLVVVPVLITLWVAWLLWMRRWDLARAVLQNAVLASIVCVLVLLPLLRYGIEHPDMLLYRAATRISDVERPIGANALQVFIDNVRNVLLMFNWTHDEVWVANLPDRPAMDSVLGALLVIGCFGAIAVSARQRSPLPLLLLIGGILMLMPSALSIAFPRENPSVVRAGGALPLLMIICALIPAHLLSAPVKSLTLRSFSTRYLPQWLSVLVLCAVVVATNYERVFVTYPMQYCKRAQNANDIAREMLEWIQKGYPSANAWLVGYPHWVDSRAVGVWIGNINFANTVGESVGRADPATVNLGNAQGWFALNEADAASLQSLKKAYPEGTYRFISGSQCEEKRFIVYTTQ